MCVLVSVCEVRGRGNLHSLVSLTVEDKFGSASEENLIMMCLAYIEIS